MKWGLIRAAIDREIWDNLRGRGAMLCYSGSADDGYRISFDHDKVWHDQEDRPGYEPRPWMTHQVLPPIPRTRAGIGDGTAYVEDYQGNRTSETFDVWAAPSGSGSFTPQGLYRKWVVTVDEVFKGWDRVDELPYEKDFWEAATRIRDAIRPLGSLSSPGESYHAACRSLGLITHDPGAQGTTPPERMWAPQINGPVDRYVIPLQGTFLNLVVLGELLAAQLDGLGNMWRSARVAVMEIGQRATAKMSGRKEFDVEALIKSAGWVLAASGLIALPVAVSIGLAATAITLSSAEEVINKIKDESKEVIDLRAALRGGAADEIIESVASTLNTDPRNGLEPQIEIDEADSIDLLGVAGTHIKNDNTVYIAKTGTYETCFTLNVSDVLVDTQDPERGVVVDLERLRDAGKVFADELGEDLRSVSRGVQEAFSSDAAWVRPEIGAGAIGVRTTGPWPEWNGVRHELVRILEETAVQVVEVGEYLISAANYLERHDNSAREAMEKAGQELDGLFK